MTHNLCAHTYIKILTALSCAKLWPDDAQKCLLFGISTVVEQKQAFKWREQHLSLRKNYIYFIGISTFSVSMPNELVALYFQEQLCCTGP